MISAYRVGEKTSHRLPQLRAQRPATLGKLEKEEPLSMRDLRPFTTLRNTLFSLVMRAGQRFESTGRYFLSLLPEPHTRPHKSTGRQPNVRWTGLV